MEKKLVPMTRSQEQELGEVVLRTRRWVFRQALPEIAATVRRILAENDERHCGANRMISDYRRLIAGTTTTYHEEK
jgi:hypothetical protein